MAVILSVELLPEMVTATGFGVKDALVFAGKGATLKLTELLPPTPTRLTVTLPPEPPRFTVSNGDDREMLKFAGTLTVTDVLCVSPLLLASVPVIKSV